MNPIRHSVDVDYSRLPGVVEGGYINNRLSYKRSIDILTYYGNCIVMGLYHNT